jgi:hypothetical protein
MGDFAIKPNAAAADKRQLDEQATVLVLRSSSIIT